MDPKIAKLDPKLKEAYERVMGTQVSAPSDNSQPPPSSEPPTHEPIASEPPPLSPAPTQNTLPPLPSESVGIPSPAVQTLPPAESPPQYPQTPPPLPPQDNAHTVDLRSPAPGAAFSSTPKVFQSFNVDSPTAAAPGHKSKTKLSPMVLVLAALVFFVVYAFLWIRVFNIGLF